MKREEMKRLALEGSDSSMDTLEWIANGGMTADWSRGFFTHHGFEEQIEAINAIAESRNPRALHFLNFLSDHVRVRNRLLWVTLYHPYARGQLGHALSVTIPKSQWNAGKAADRKLSDHYLAKKMERLVPASGQRRLALAAIDRAIARQEELGSARMRMYQAFQSDDAQLLAESARVLDEDDARAVQRLKQSAGGHFFNDRCDSVRAIKALAYFRGEENIDSILDSAKKDEERLGMPIVEQTLFLLGLFVYYDGDVQKVEESLVRATTYGSLSFNPCMRLLNATDNGESVSERYLLVVRALAEMGTRRAAEFIGRMLEECTMKRDLRRDFGGHKTCVVDWDEDGRKNVRYEWVQNPFPILRYFVSVEFPNAQFLNFNIEACNRFFDKLITDDEAYAIPGLEEEFAKAEKTAIARVEEIRGKWAPVISPILARANELEEGGMGRFPMRMNGMFGNGWRNAFQARSEAPSGLRRGFPANPKHRQ